MITAATLITAAQKATGVSVSVESARTAKRRLRRTPATRVRIFECVVTVFCFPGCPSPNSHHPSGVLLAKICAGAPHSSKAVALPTYSPPC